MPWSKTEQEVHLSGRVQFYIGGLGKVSRRGHFCRDLKGRRRASRTNAVKPLFSTLGAFDVTSACVARQV